MKHVVIGTAGHIDHGKSALVLALTGTDPDRLPEEKARGITIDLGFAHTIEDGVALSFVDVPGHERFIRNMLAGVGGIDLVMLHVAADESVMPQTREHFDICRLLRVAAGLVVITKADLADAATLDVVRLEIQDLVAGSFLQHAPIVAVSARTGAGVAELRRMLARLATSAVPRPCDGAPRLPIDRVFSVKGFGTVVTGTLIDGTVAADDRLVLQPSGRQVKVRGLQVHGQPHRFAMAGQRVAVNLAGVEVADVTRGETLTEPGGVTTSRRLDIELEVLPSANAIRHGARVRFHQGTREVAGRVALPGSSGVQPGAATFARLHLEAPAALVRGDRFILRAGSPVATIAGGTVLDPSPPRRGVRTPPGSRRFTTLSRTTSPAIVVMTMIEEAGVHGLSESQLGGRAGLASGAKRDVLGELGERVVHTGNVLVSAACLTALEERMLDAVGHHHTTHPLDEGMPREELRERLCGGAPLEVFAEALRRLVTRHQIVARDRVGLPGRTPALSDEETHARAAIVQVLDEAGLTPPETMALATRVGVESSVLERLVSLLVREQVLVRVGGLLFHHQALDRLKADVRALRGTGADAVFDVAGFKDRYQVSRKYAIPLLEFLDRERVTRRVGEKRHVL